MHETTIFGLVALVALGAAAQLVAHHARVPSILMLLAAGFVFGPLLGWVTPEKTLGDVTLPLVSLGAAVVLFEGGLTIHLEDLRANQKAVSRLISVGMLVTWALATAASVLFTGLSFELSVLLGAILVVTGPTVIGPILRHARPVGSVGRILKFEGIINDPIGAVLALIVFQVIQVEQVETAALLIAWGVVRAVLAASILGLLGGYAYVVGRKRGIVPNVLQNAVLIPLVLGVYALANLVQPEAGLLAVTVMGMVIASRTDISVAANVEFAEHLRTLLISVLFVLLTARIERSDLSALPWGGLAFAAALILVVRPAAALLATWGTGLPFREKLFLSFMAPRGIVAAAVASVFAYRLAEEGVADARLLLPLTFLVIAVCVIGYGLGAKPLTHLLHLHDREPQGVLLLGENDLSRKIAVGLLSSGREPVIVSSEWRRVLRLRRLGFRAECGQIQSSALLDRLELENIGCLIALTPDDDKNTVACAQFRKMLGDEGVAQVAFSEEHMAQSDSKWNQELRGKPIFGGKHFEELLELGKRASAKVTAITEEFSFDAFVEHYQGRAFPLLALTATEAPRVLDEDNPPQPGEEVLSLVLDDETEEETA